MFAKASMKFFLKFKPKEKKKKKKLIYHTRIKWWSLESANPSRSLACRLTFLLTISSAKNHGLPLDSQSITNLLNNKHTSIDQRPPLLSIQLKIIQPLVKISWVHHLQDLSPIPISQPKTWIIRTNRNTVIDSLFLPKLIPRFLFPGKRSHDSDCSMHEKMNGEKRAITSSIGCLILILVVSGYLPRCVRCQDDPYDPPANNKRPRIAPLFSNFLSQQFNKSIRRYKTSIQRTLHYCTEDVWVSSNMHHSQSPPISHSTSYVHNFHYVLGTKT